MNQKVKIDLDLFDWLVRCIDWIGEIGDFGQGIVWRDWGFWGDGPGFHHYDNLEMAQF